MSDDNEERTFLTLAALTFPEMKGAFRQCAHDWKADPDNQVEAAPGNESICVIEALEEVVTLLVLGPVSPTRDHFLERYFTLAELLVQRGRHHDLQYSYEMVEGNGPWWHCQIPTLLGPYALSALDSYQPGWRKRTFPQPIVTDSHGVREIVRELLGVEEMPNERQGWEW